MKVQCTACSLHDQGRTNCMAGWGNPLAKLQIWIDSPAEEADTRGKPQESKQARFVNWLLRRNSISLQDVYVGYTLRCFIPKNVLKKKADRLESLNACMGRHNLQVCKNAKAIVALGEISCLEFMGVTKVGEAAGMNRDMIEPWKHRVYGGYAPGYCLATPSESVGVSRSIWFAAEFCGLKPKIDLKELQNFDYEIF